MLSPQQLPADPAFLGAEYELGNHKATYEPATTCQIIMLSVLLAVSIVGTLVVVLFAAALGGVIGGAFGVVIPLFFVLIMLFIVGAAIFGIVRAYQNRVMRVMVYDEGLVYVGRENGRVIHWRDVLAVWHNVVVHTHTSTDGQGNTSTSTSVSHTYILSCSDGSSLKLDQTFGKLRQLGKMIEMETARYLFPGAFGLFQAGRPVPFGPLALAPYGLYYGQEMLPWNELKSVTINENYGQVVIKKQGKLFRWASVKLGEVPNVEVFRALLQRATGIWF